MRRWLGLGLLACGMAFGAMGCGGGARPAAAIVGDEAVARALEGDLGARARLRAAGPEGMARVLAAYDATPETDGQRRRELAALVDAVARQKDAVHSRLYWYTDLAQAKAAAKESGRPILSLRLLGELDDELSCANSRFFRTALYPNREVNALLREGFVLHWSTERPAPVMTIDFRDGRVVKRTVTGNSLHYVLDAEGRVVDAIPGLWGPAAFTRVVARAGEVARVTSTQRGATRVQALSAYHDGEVATLRRAWFADSARLGLVALLPADDPGYLARARPLAPPPKGAPPPAPPAAVVAMPIAASKRLVEMPMVGALVPPQQVEIASATEDAVPWARYATLHRDDARLDETTRAVIRLKAPRIWEGRDLGRPRNARELEELDEAFETSMAEDTVKNAYLHHALVHLYLARAASTDADGSEPFERTNAWVYTSLFRTPASDPWLGLVPPNVYSGIQDDGIVLRP